MKKIIQGTVFTLFVMVFTVLATLKLGANFAGTERISQSASILQKFEKTGKLQVITFYMDQVLDEREKRYLFWIDELFPDTKVLISVTSQVSACIDLAQLQEEDIAIDDQSVTLTLPAPEFCSDPIIDLDSVTKHLESGFGASDLQIEALKRGKELAKEQAEENQIFQLAKDQGEVMISGLLTEVSEKRIIIQYAD